MTRKESSTRITITVAARRTGVEPSIVSYCVQVGLISERFTEEELADLRRVRRLKNLGVNMPGIEIILRMRRRIEELQTEVERLEAERYSPDTGRSRRPGRLREP
jgi:MerR family transcriptional regulator, heat shock protein HspR